MDCRRIAILLVLVLFLVGCRGNDDLFASLPTPVSSPPREGETDDPGGVEAEVLAGMNREREKRGLPALALDERLTAAAQMHSADMARGDFFDHEGSDGSRTGERVSAQGYRWRFYAENIACGQRSADEVLQSWLESKPHRDNILSDQAEHAGVGLVRREGTRCTFFWTAVYAAENKP